MVARIHQVTSTARRGRRPLLGLYRRVVLTLVLLRSNASQTLLADLFGISQSTVSRIYRAMVPLFEQVTCLHRPPLPKVFRGRVVLVDATLIPIGNRRTDRDTHEANYSGKRHKAGVNIQVLSDLTGQLLAVSDPVPGRTHDRAGFTIAGYDHLLADTPTIGDLGYQGTHVIRPHRKRPGHKHHTPADKIWNHSIAHYRAAIERAIAHIKQWKILATGYRGRLTELPNLIRTITTLEYNRRGWQPLLNNALGLGHIITPSVRRDTVDARATPLMPFELPESPQQRPPDRAAQPRQREALRVLVSTRAGAVSARTAAINHLKALIVSAPENLRAELRGRTSDIQIAYCAKLRDRLA